MGDTPNFEGLWGTTLQLDFDFFFFHIYDISSKTYKKLPNHYFSQGIPLNTILAHFPF